MRPSLAPTCFPRGVPLAFWLTGLCAARSVLALGQPKWVGFQPSAEAFPLEVAGVVALPGRLMSSDPGQPESPHPLQSAGR